MKDFNYIPTLNPHGVELVETYERFVSGNASAFEKRALEKAFRDEKCKGISDAISAKNLMSVDAFTDMLRTYAKYIEVQQMAAMNYLRDNVSDEALVSVIKVGTTSVGIQKRVGFKREAFLSYFGMSSDKDFNEFGKKYWNTRVKKLINDVLAQNKIPNVKVVVSETYKVQDRNMLNIDVDFQFKPEHLTAELVQNILSVCNALENIVQMHK